MPSACSPAGAAEAAAALREAAAGGGTASIGGAGGDLEVRTAALDRIRHHEPGDLTVIVEAGVRLSALQARLAAHGQRLSLDPPGDPTLGACLAGDLSGPLRHRFGSMRDLVLGVEVVLGDGTVAHAGGTVVKNVAGYDLGKLLCGSHGSLGLVTTMGLRLHPAPEAAATVVAHAATPAQAARLVGLLLGAGLLPSAVDVLWPGRVLALFEGRAGAVADAAGKAAGLIGGREADGAVWDEVRTRQGAARGRVSFAPGALADLLWRTDEAVVRAGAGVAYADLPPTGEDDAVLALRRRILAALDPGATLVRGGPWTAS